MFTPVSLDRQAGISAAEAERVAKCRPEVEFFRAARHVIQRTFWVRLLLIDRRRQNSGIDAHDRGDEFDSAGRGQKMADHGLDRADLEGPGVRAEDRHDGATFELIVKDGGRY